MLMSSQTRCVENFPCNLLGQDSAVLFFSGGGEWTQGLMYVRPAFYQGLMLGWAFDVIGTGEASELTGACLATIKQLLHSWWS